MDFRVFTIIHIYFCLLLTLLLAFVIGFVFVLGLVLGFEIGELVLELFETIKCAQGLLFLYSFNTESEKFVSSSKLKILKKANFEILL